MRLLSARVLLVAASIVLFLGAVTLYVRAAVLDPREFSDRATATLEDSEARTVVSTRIVDAAIEQGSAELIQARPLLEAAVAGALDTGAPMPPRWAAKYQPGSSTADIELWVPAKTTSFSRRAHSSA